MSTTVCMGKDQSQNLAIGAKPKRKRDIDVQRAFRARKAAHLEDLEQRVALAELENARLRRENVELKRENEHLLQCMTPQAGTEPQPNGCESFSSSSCCPKPPPSTMPIVDKTIAPNVNTTKTAAHETINPSEITPGAAAVFNADTHAKPSSAVPTPLGPASAIDSAIDPHIRLKEQRVVCCNGLFICEETQSTWTSQSKSSTGNTIDDLLELFGADECAPGNISSKVFEVPSATMAAQMVTFSNGRPSL